MFILETVPLAAPKFAPPSPVVGGCRLPPASGAGRAGRSTHLAAGWVRKEKVVTVVSVNIEFKVQHLYQEPLPQASR